MTGGALGSLIAQVFHLTAAERKTLLVAGAAAAWRRPSARRWPPCCWRSSCCCSSGSRAASSRSRWPARVAALLRPYLLGAGPLFPVAGASRRPADGRPAGVRRRRPAGGAAGAAADAGRLRGRGRLPPPADPLDVVAGARRAGRRPRRPDPAARARRRLRHHRRPAATGDTTRGRSIGAARRQGADLGGRAGLGHVGRRAGAAAHHGRRAWGRSSRRSCPAATGALAAGQHGGGARAARCARR